MRQYLPSKNFIYIFLSIVFAIGIIYFFSTPKNTGETSLKNLEGNISTSSQKILILDSDNDGLRDWEETIWKTDIKNPDTDGDGTNDAEEIKLKRDPLKPNTALKDQAPNDIMSEQIAGLNPKISEDFDKLSVTEKMSQELFLQYLSVKQKNPTLSEADINKIVDNTLSYLPKITFKIYTKKDLQVSSLSDKISLQNYGNNVAKIILENIQTETEPVDNIINDASEISDSNVLTEQTTEIFKRFDPLITKNKKTVADLLTMVVPENFVPEHLKLLNSFGEIYESLDLMKKGASDIIITAIINNNYSASSVKLSNALQELTKKIYTLEVTFVSVNDYGHLLFDGIMLMN